MEGFDFKVCDENFILFARVVSEVPDLTIDGGCYLYQPYNVRV